MINFLHNFEHLKARLSKIYIYKYYIIHNSFKYNLPTLRLINFFKARTNSSYYPHGNIEKWIILIIL